MRFLLVKEIEEIGKDTVGGVKGNKTKAEGIGQM